MLKKATISFLRYIGCLNFTKDHTKHGLLQIQAFFFNSEKHRNYTLCSCEKVCEALTFVLDNIYIRFVTKLFRHIVGIPMGTNCTPLVADLFLFCYERDFMMSFLKKSNLKLLKLSARRLDI